MKQVNMLVAIAMVCSSLSAQPTAEQQQQEHAYLLASEFREYKVAFGNRKKLSFAQVDQLNSDLQTLKAKVAQNEDLQRAVTVLTVPLLMRVFRGQNIVTYLDYYINELQAMLSKPWPEQGMRLLQSYQQALAIANKKVRLDYLTNIVMQMTAFIKAVYNLKTEDFSAFNKQLDIHRVIDARTDADAQIQRLKTEIARREQAMTEEKRRR